MNFDENMSYLNGFYRNDSFFENKFEDTFEGVFNTSGVTLSGEEYQFSDSSKFYQELLRLSGKLGLGDKISVDTFYDGKIPEKIFTIHCDVKLEKEQKYLLSEYIHESMKSFSNSQNITDFFNDAYIIIR